VELQAGLIHTTDIEFKHRDGILRMTGIEQYTKSGAWEFDLTLKVSESNDRSTQLALQ
jgi:hypothetical protein